MQGLASRYRGVPHEQALRPAATPDHDRHAVDDEPAAAVRAASLARRHAGEVRGDRADAEVLGVVVRPVVVVDDRVDGGAEGMTSQRVRDMTPPERVVPRRQ